MAGVDLSGYNYNGGGPNGGGPWNDWPIPGYDNSKPLADQVTQQPQPTGSAPSTGSPAPAPQSGGNPWDAYTNHPFYQQISQAYQRYFGRTPGGSEVWDRLQQGRGLTPENLERQLNDISHYYQASDYRDRGAGYVPPAPAGASAGGPFDINAYGQGWVGSGGRTLQDWQNYVQSHPLGAGYSVGGSKGDKVIGPNGQGWDAVIASGMGGTGASWNPLGGSGVGGGTAGSVFSDPATAQWEQLLRTLTDRLQQPQPTYTDAQRDIIQTQALDPLTRERDAARQRVTEQYAAHGHQPGHSGIVDAALQDVDRQFEQMRTQQQSGFAVNQINREDQMFNSNEQRALAGLNLFHQIPQLADQRLATANAMLMPMNPAALLGLQNQQYGQNQQNAQWNQLQDQQFWQWLGNLFVNSNWGR